MSKEVQRIKTLLNLESFDGYKGLIKPIENVVKERDDAVKSALAFNTELNELMSDELLDRLGLENGYTPEQFHASMKVLFNELSTLRSRPDTTQPQLTEERYVLHGDIKPCTVLYSDDTTTLLRLPEGDMMCETDTVEWSDSVTYRCQELLREESKRSGHRVSLPTVKSLAQLVRDERILLNDNGGEVRNAIPCPPAPAPKPTCNNQYKHNSTLCEQDLRNAGWTTEGLVQNGYGHYIPTQQPANTEFTSNNSPTPLR